VIEPDPEVSADFIEAGFNVMTFSHAQYQIPKWRRDYPGHNNSWKKLLETANRHAELKAIDERLKVLDEQKEWD